MRHSLPTFLALSLTPLICSGQETAVATRVARVHSSATSSSSVVVTLQPGDIVTIPRHKLRNTFYPVQTQNEQSGWVTAHSLRFLDPTEAHQPGGASDVQSPPPNVVVDADKFDNCPAIGTAVRADVQALNKLKNRSAEPQESEFDTAVTIAGMLAPHDDAQRFDEHRAVHLTALVYRVIPGGASETTNCKKGDPVHRDTHIELVANPSDTDQTQRVIVEVTPRWRAALLRGGVDWSTATLQRALEGHWVTVTGWLMFDSEHKGEALNTAPGNESDWRATAWEIHPITDIRLTSHP